MPNPLAIAGPKSKYQKPGSQPAGFLAGLWHGLICPFTFIASLFTDDVRMYETNNTGRGYEFGFILGASGALGGGGSQAS
jgi:hypothetical protein